MDSIKVIIICRNSKVTTTSKLIRVFHLNLQIKHLLPNIKKGTFLVFFGLVFLYNLKSNNEDFIIFFSYFK